MTLPVESDKQSVLPKSVKVRDPGALRVYGSALLMAAGGKWKKKLKLIKLERKLKRVAKMVPL